MRWHRFKVCMCVSIKMSAGKFLCFFCQRVHTSFQNKLLEFWWVQRFTRCFVAVFILLFKSVLFYF